MSLCVISGPMKSGKTYRLVEKANQWYMKTNKKVLLVSCELDTRDPEKRISSHFGYFADLNNIFDIVIVDHKKLREVNISDHEVICVDETQFFESVWEIIYDWKYTHKKHIICAGLLADYQLKPFGEMCNLLSFATEHLSMKAICPLCKGSIPTAIHTKKKIASEKLIEIGADIYEPRCDEHY